MSQVMGHPSPPPLQIPVRQSPPPQILSLPQVLIRLLSLVHCSVTNKQKDRHRLLPKENIARRKRLMWNSCAVDFLNNLLKINFNGKLRTEISSAVLCSQRVTHLHKRKGRVWHQEHPWELGGMGAGLAGSCSPQSAQLWAGSCFWELCSL